MSRLFFAILMTSSLLSPCASSAETAAWVCKPVWRFSGMGDKTYEGLSATEASAKDLARKSCVIDNRGMELDDFCLPDPKGNDWHCAQEPQQVINSAPGESR